MWVCERKSGREREHENLGVGVLCGSCRTTQPVACIDISVDTVQHMGISSNKAAHEVTIHHQSRNDRI